VNALLSALLFLLPGPTLAQTGVDVRNEQPPEPSTVGSGRQVSRELREALKQVDVELARTEAGRRLLAETADVPVTERFRSSFQEAGVEKSPVRWARTSGEIVVDSELAPTLNAFDYEVLFMRERRRAGVRSPIPLVDEEQAAHQEALSYAVEKAASNAAFSKLLRKAYEEGGKVYRSRAALVEAARRQGLRFPPPWRPPGGALALLGQELYLFSEDPHLFYAAIEDGLDFSSETVRLDEVEDFLDMHGAGLERVEWRAGGRYAEAGGRLYPGRAARAAFALREREALPRLRERLGPYRSVQSSELRKKANQWIREGR
jgi:hypothetical protein